MNSKEIRFKEVSEQWFSYRLSDGTILKLKPILIKVLDDGKDSQGNPRFSLQATNVIGISLPESENIDELRKPEKDLKPTPLDDNWNEYELDYESGTKITLKLKPGIAQIDRTGEIDPMGLPIYIIQAQQLIKLHK